MENEITNETYTNKEGTSSLEVSKMTKGYNWKIKVYNSDLKKLMEQVIELDNQAKEAFGSLND